MYIYIYTIVHLWSYAAFWGARHWNFTWQLWPAVGSAVQPPKIMYYPKLVYRYLECQGSSNFARGFSIISCSENANGSSRRGTSMQIWRFYLDPGPLSHSMRKLISPSTVDVPATLKFYFHTASSENDSMASIWSCSNGWYPHFFGGMFCPFLKPNTNADGFTVQVSPRLHSLLHHRSPRTSWPWAAWIP